VYEIVDAETLEHQHHVAEVRALDLRHRVLLKLIRVRPCSVQTEALASGNTTSSTSTLLGRGL
jgi:hypothetical protein